MPEIAHCVRDSFTHFEFDNRRDSSARVCFRTGFSADAGAHTHTISSSNLMPRHRVHRCRWTYILTFLGRKEQGTMQAALPWPSIKQILVDQAVALEAVVQTLPLARSQRIKTPGLVRMLSGSPWSDDMEAASLVKLYASIVFLTLLYPTARHRGDHFDRAYTLLLHEQATNLSARFDIVAHLRAYERFILKYIHLAKVGGDVSLAAVDGHPPLSFFVLTMHDAALAHFEDLFTAPGVQAEQPARGSEATNIGGGSVQCGFNETTNATTVPT